MVLREAGDLGVTPGTFTREGLRGHEGEGHEVAVAVLHATVARVGEGIVGGELPYLIARPFSGTLLKKAKTR